jgi:hypothetical protein
MGIRSIPTLLAMSERGSCSMSGSFALFLRGVDLSLNFVLPSWLIISYVANDNGPSRHGSFSSGLFHAAKMKDLEAARMGLSGAKPGLCVILDK